MYMLDVNFKQIVELINNRKNNAYRKINEEMIQLYFEVGKYVNELKEKSTYGDKISEKVAEFLKNNYPELKGFTK